MRGILLFILSLIHFSILCAQSIRIEKVLDNGIYRLSSGKVVKLAGLYLPTFSSLKYNPDLVNEIYTFQSNFFCGRQFDSTNITESSDSLDISLIYIFNKRIFFTEDLNLKMLEYGYARVSPDIDSLHKASYLQAEMRARINEAGLWDMDKMPKAGLIDSSFYAFDSIGMLRIVLIHNSAPIITSMLEIASGAAFGVAGIYSGWIIGGPYAARDFDFTGPFIGAALGYMLCAPLGVYLVGHYNNPGVDYGMCVLSSLVTTIVFSGLACIKIQNQNPLVVLPLLAPILGPTFYANSELSSYEKKPGDFIIYSDKNSKINSHKDLYDRSISFRLELLKLNF